MRLPWGRLDEIVKAFLNDRQFGLLGCVSFEDRCLRVPRELFGNPRLGVLEMLRIAYPLQSLPDYTQEISTLTNRSQDRFNKSAGRHTTTEVQLLATEDELIEVVLPSKPLLQCSTIVFDITSVPQRCFGLLVKRMMMSSALQDVIVTYTLPGSEGYTEEHLVDDPMTCDHLPGYSGPLPPRGDTLVVSIGFEALGIDSLLELYMESRRAIKIVMSFPPDGRYLRRQWDAVRQMASVDARFDIRENLEVVAAWDAGTVYSALERWDRDADALTLAPFGPKPHSLGMALYAIKSGAGMYYTQPKSYNPNYSKGIGDAWAYVVKWDGIACFDR